LIFTNIKSRQTPGPVTLGRVVIRTQDLRRVRVPGAALPGSDPGQVVHTRARLCSASEVRTAWRCRNL